MKNKGLLARSPVSPLGAHKLDDAPMADSTASLSAGATQPVAKPGRHRPVTIAPDPEGSRYTLSLKIEKSVADIIAYLCGSADLGNQSGAKRLLTLQFRVHLLAMPVILAPRLKITSPATLRLDIRLPEDFVRHVLAVQRAAPFQPRATTLAVHLAPVLTEFLKAYTLER